MYYTSGQELHAMWDLLLPRRISSNVNDLASALIPGSLASQAATSGDYHHWPEVWAGESMTQANAAYAPINFKSAAYVPNPRHTNTLMLKISIELPGGSTGYKQAQQQRTQDQLTKAAVHLAQLLSKIDFK